MNDTTARLTKKKKKTSAK